MQNCRCNEKCKWCVSMYFRGVRQEKFSHYLTHQVSPHTCSTLYSAYLCTWIGKPEYNRLMGISALI